MQMLREEKIKMLQGHAKEIRKTLLTMIYKAQSGHPGGSLSSADIMAALYFDELKVDPRNPKWEQRDRFVLSKGHVCPVLYTCLALRGFFPKEEIDNLRKFGSILQGHPDMKRTPGVDISTGSLGQGISCAVGMAIANKRDKNTGRVFCLVGDGETNEGQVWESIQVAVKYGLDNLIVFADNNGLQNDGTCEEIMPTQDLYKKFEAFGCRTYAIDGHDMAQIVDVLDTIRRGEKGKPHVVVAKTVKGKGVSFMENVVKWHGLAPNEQEYNTALKEIEEGLQ
ncbi:MAG: transketolase [Acetivibrionales bacterium]|jgi:transketolase